MAAATSMLLALLWSSPRLGAALVPPGSGLVFAGGGINVLLPMATIGAGVGLAEDFDLEAAYEVHGGIAHELGLTGRWAFGERYALGLELSHGFFGLEEIDGAKTARAPLGAGFTTSPLFMASLYTERGAHVGLSAGMSFRWWRPKESDDSTLAQAFDPSVHVARLEASVEWPRESGTIFLRVRAVVPVQADFKVLGYFPMVVAGYTWALP